MVLDSHQEKPPQPSVLLAKLSRSQGFSMTTKNVFFIDSRVSDYQSLITSLRADSEWVLIDGSRDGVLQMQSALAGHSNLDSIQVISHGSAGTLYLGSTVLGSSNLESYSSQLRSIGSSLTDSGDLLLYGCNVAQGDAGKLFIDSLAAMSQADVAASNDLTGGSGDLILEVSSGDIEQGESGFRYRLSTTNLFKCSRPYQSTYYYRFQRPIDRRYVGDYAVATGKTK
jgi:hypothetical protein